MQLNRSRYPGYDILKEQEHWDDHTRKIVLKRMGPFPEHQFLNKHEAQMVLVVARHVVYENRQEILDYCVHHLDSSLSKSLGENQRKKGVPEQKTLVREGLKAIDELAQKQYGAAFLDIEEKEQLILLTALSTGKAMSLPVWQGIPQKQLFKKLASLVVGAYYSHPTVWSEIGYGGPAYPRGYVRIEKGLTDPWEAKRDANES